MTMFQRILKFGRLPVALIALVLSACGGGGSDTPDPSRVLQESELYHPVSNPSGVVEQPGQTVVLGLQADTSDLPPLLNLASKGVEDLWFEVQDAQSMQMELDADTLAAIDRLEVRDQNNALLAIVNASTPSTTLSLAPGRYQALLYASAADTDPVPVFVQYANGQDDSTRVRGASASNTAQQRDALSWKMHFSRGCPGCRLSGKDFSGWDLQGANFRGSALARANFTKANLAGANLAWSNLAETDLSEANLSGAFLYKANLAGADLFAARFHLAVLTKANLSGANLSKTSFIQADLTGALLGSTKPYLASLDGAKLSGALWNDGRICLQGSIGICSR